MLLRTGSAICFLVLSITVAGADTAVLAPVQDTMIQEDSEVRSNGIGTQFCVGGNGGALYRRALIKFDLASIPPGSTITSVTLQLYVNRAAALGGGTFDLHRLTEDWGEGTSNAGSGECQGAEGELNDATWRYRFYDPADEPGSPQWAVLGGDFVTPPSASLVLGSSLGSRQWSSAQMAADVQAWLNGTSGSYGWILKRDVESGDRTALRFASRHNPSTGQRPRLTVDFDPPVGMGGCCFPAQACQVLEAVDCFEQGGIFQGAGSDCTPNPCPPDATGACCAEAGGCTIETLAACNASDGTYYGDDTNCAAIDCPITLEPFVDALPIPAVAQPVSGSAGGQATYDIVMQEVQQQLHRDLPPTTVWGYGDDPSNPASATFPGPTIETTSDQQVTVHWINDLRDTSAPTNPKPHRTDHYLDVDGTPGTPDCAIHGAEDLPKTVVHLHGAHVPSAFDGHPDLTFLPGNEEAYVYPNHQQPTTLWYHDHALGITRLNVYMGLAGFWLVRDAYEQGLGLPGGEYEIPLVIQDREFQGDGSLAYPSNWVQHFFGDKILVNGKVWPYLNVKQGKYRFRLLNGSGSRTYQLTLDRLDLPGQQDMQFIQIGTDGGLLEMSVSPTLITLGPAERADVVLDFEPLAPGTEVVLTNHAPAPFPGTPGVGLIPEVMKFVVQDAEGFTDLLPSSLRPVDPLLESDAIKVRDFTLNRAPGTCGVVWKINGLGWDDITEYPQLGTTEIWRFINPRNVMHPMHMHLVFFQVLDRTPIGGGGSVPPDPNEKGWKDTVRATGQMVTRVIARFDDYPGRFPYHCHILEHEDHEMMRQFWTIEGPELASLPDKATISWNAQPGSIGYDVVRGDLNELIATGGNFAFPQVTTDCLAENEPTTSVEDSDPVPQGSGFWYLVRPVDSITNGTYDSGFRSQDDRRDDEIFTSGNDCD